MLLTEISRVDTALSYLPDEFSREILHLAERRSGGRGRISEIALRVGGRCEVCFGVERIPLSRTLDSSSAEKTVAALTDGSLYAHRDSIAEGFLTIGRGIRVGIGGVARYDGGRIVGISSIGSLIFRIPTGDCSFKEELVAVYEGGIGTGMLIYSPPGVGKTTALRALAAHVGGAMPPRRVAVIDERGEFLREDYVGASVDVLTGYKRGVGIGIATRTMAPDLIITDELSAEDADAVDGAVRSGVPIIASAHASSYRELMGRAPLRRLLFGGVFEVFVGISRDGGGYRLTVDRR